MTTPSVEHRRLEYVFTAEQSHELGRRKMHGRRAAMRPAPMHFMHGPIAGVLPEVIQSIPPAANVTITETTAQDGKKALTITATWNEDQ